MHGDLDPHLRRRPHREIVREFGARRLKDDPHGIEIDEHGQIFVDAGADQIADIDEPTTDSTIERRCHFRVSKVDLSIDEAGLGDLHLRGRRLKIRPVLVKILSGDRTGRHQWLVPRVFTACEVEGGLRRTQLALSLQNVRFERGLLDDEERLAGLDRSPFFEESLL